VPPSFGSSTPPIVTGEPERARICSGVRRSKASIPRSSHVFTDPSQAPSWAFAVATHSQPAWV
jgi:hypothetical protein